jgi:RNA polymerase sigma factor (sigma-70 family)
MSSKSEVDGGAAARPVTEAARKRAAIETYVRHEAVLRRTARRYSLCADDADDALQRTLEILLRKAPSEDPRDLIRWTQTVLRHEALAVRRERERILSGPAAVADPEREDWVALLPTDADGPPEQAERREAIARSREALRTLKPQELRALTLLAQGYSYVEIGEITGFSQTKINRCLAEGRERYRSFLARSEEGARCAEMGPLLSAFCDGEASKAEAASVREHLRACAACRVTLRAYRAAPGAALSLAPALAFGRSLLERTREAVAELAGRLGGGVGPDSALSQAATGGAGGAGLLGMAKAAAVCAAGAGGAAACVATGVVPVPLELGHDRVKAPALERRIDPTLTAAWQNRGVPYQPAPAPTSAEPKDAPQAREDVEAGAPSPDLQEASAPGVVEYAPPPEPPSASEPPSESDTTGTADGDPAGEFGP